MLNSEDPVWWEQRGAGLSYSPDIPPETITAEQLIEDTLALTHHLCSRFSKEKVYLMAHSGGTFVGIQAVARAPHLYYAYIGVGQMVNQLESERRAYAYMLERFRENGNTEMVRNWRPHQSLLTEYRGNISRCATKLCTVSGSAPCGE